MTLDTPDEVEPVDETVSAEAIQETESSATFWQRVDAPKLIIAVFGLLVIASAAAVGYALLDPKSKRWDGVRPVYLYSCAIAAVVTLVIILALLIKARKTRRGSKVTDVTTDSEQRPTFEQEHAPQRDTAKISEGEGDAPAIPELHQVHTPDEAVAAFNALMGITDATKEEPALTAPTAATTPEPAPTLVAPAAPIDAAVATPDASVDELPEFDGTTASVTARASWLVRHRPDLSSADLSVIARGGELTSV